MAKSKLKIQGMLLQHRDKKVSDVLTRLKGVQSTKTNISNNEALVRFDASRISNYKITSTISEVGYIATERISTSLWLFLSVALLLFIGIIGCSDVPYTGPVLTVDNVDRYLNSTGEDTVCLQDGFDTICLKVVEQEDSEDEPPTVYIHPASIAFVFYYENRPILRAEKIMDTTEVVQELIDTGKVQLPPDAAGNSDNIDISDEWLIEIYYPESFPEANRGSTPVTSGFDIRIGEGMKLSANKRDDLEILNFKQITGPNGIPGVRFSVESDDTEISIQVNGLVPEYTAKFYIKADGVASDENTYTFQLQPNASR